MLWIDGAAPAAPTIRRTMPESAKGRYILVASSSTGAAIVVAPLSLDSLLGSEVQALGTYAAWSGTIGPGPAGAATAR